MIKKNVCIVGSGIGIGTFLDQIEFNQFEKITIVEAGGVHATEDAVLKENIGREFGVRTTTAIQVGGTSNLWHGVLSPLSPDDFDVKEYVKCSGWPISFSDLEEFYKKAARVLGVDEYLRFFPDSLEEGIKSLFDDIDYNNQLLDNKLFQQPVPAKNFKDMVLKLNEEYSNINLLIDHVALEMNVEFNRVRSLRVGSKDGTTSLIEADLFIIGAGALETPRLLLNSNFTNDNIGRYLMDHPMGNLCQLEFLKPRKAPLYSDLKLSSSQKIKTGLVMKKRVRNKLKLLNHNFYLRPSFIRGIDDESEKVKLSLLAFKDGKVSFSDFWRVVTSLNTIRQILTYKLSLNVKYKFADLFFVCEQRPNPESRVSLSDKKDKWGYPIAKVNWQVLPEDIEDMKQWFKLVLEEFFSDESYRFTHRLEDFNWEQIYTSAIHHVGTARMSNSCENGVVDQNLKVHDVDNLYICDGSVFPTSGNVNSSFTISALACRLAHHIENEYKL